MNILIISQYFWPENFRLNDLAENLIKNGHNVTVLTGKPNYPHGNYFQGYNFFNKNFEIWNSIKIIRVPLIPRGKGGKLKLFFNYISFLFFSIIRIIFLYQKFDKILVYQLSPATVGFPALIAKIKFKAPILFYIQDLWPESITDTGGLKSKFVTKLLDKMMDLFYQQSSIIIVQSSYFIPYLIEKGVPENKLKYIPNTVEEFYKPQKNLDKYLNYFPEGFNIVFAGNIGFAQDFDTIVQTAILLKSKQIPVNWIIIGDGRAKDNLIKQIDISNLNNFYFLGSFQSSEMPYFLSCSDLLLVSLKQSLIFSLTIPSKIQSYLACKKPIIGNLSGIGAKIIKDANCGLASDSGDFVNLSKNIEYLYNLAPIELEELGNNGYNYFLNNFQRKIVYKNFEFLLNLNEKYL
jgi:glycosyltransferase involved in cell wall biosynthesis